MKKRRLDISKLKVIKKWIKPANTLYHYRSSWVKKFISHFVERDKVVLDLGCGERKISKDVISVDLIKNKNVDIVANAAEIPLRENSIDLIVCTAVLEHVEDVEKTITEMRRVLKNGGIIYLEVPFLQNYHAHPHDYRRFTLAGLELLFSDFKKIDSGVCIGPFSALACLIQKMPRFIMGENIFGFFLEFITGWFVFWIKYFDVLIPAAKKVHQLASGLYFLGEKEN